MENGIIQSAPQQSERDIITITAEIREITRQARTMALMYVIEIGRRLVEAKSQLAHGEWSDWLREEINISQSTANNYMRLFEEYGDAQISIFGAVANSQTIGNLPYSKALQLLSIPAEEREEFAEQVNADRISVRELKAAIEERDRAKEEAEQSRREKEELADKLAEVKGAADRAEEAVAAAEEARKKVNELTEKLAYVTDAAEDAKKKYQDAVANPQIPPKKLAEIRKEAADKAKAAAAKEGKDALDAAKRAMEDAERKLQTALLEKANAEEELAEARAKIKKANPEVAAFAAIFEEIQKIAVTLKQKIAAIRENDAETADKLQKAISAFGAALQREASA